MTEIDIVIFLSVILLVLKNYLIKNNTNKVINIVYLGLISITVFLPMILCSIRITMIFIYISVFVTILGELKQLFSSNQKKFINFKVSIFLIIFSLLSFVLTCWFMPIFKAIPPSGEYQIGQIRQQLVDKTRNDPFNKSEKRKLNIKIYYPVQKTQDCKLGSYFDGRSMFQSFGCPSFLGSYLKNVKSNSYLNAPIIETKKNLPLIVFSHGMGSIPEAYTSIIEELASNGYVVACINHTDYSMFSIIDNQSIPFKAQNVEKEMGGKDKANSVVIKDSLSIWSSDVEFVMNELKSGNAIFTKVVDFNNIAVIGHSFGGATAADLLYKDSNIKAGIDLDGPIYGNALKGVSQPFMFLISDRKGINYDNIQKSGGDTEKVRSIIGHFFNSVEEMSKNSNGDIYKITIKGSSHSSFSDMLLYSPFKYFDNYPSQIDPHKALKISKEYILNFMNTYLKASKNGNNEIQKYDEVEFEYKQKK